MKTFFFAVQPWYIKPQITTTPPSSLTHSLPNIASKITSPFKYYSSHFNDVRITLVTLPNNISTFTAATKSSSSVSEINKLIRTWLLLVRKSVLHFFSLKWTKVRAIWKWNKVAIWHVVEHSLSNCSNLQLWFISKRKIWTKVICEVTFAKLLQHVIWTPSNTFLDQNLRSRVYEIQYHQNCYCS